ncbi:MAG: methylated-DNA--[protein]-cysteine S-methyltransferase [Bacteroidota bacterium]
MKAEKEQSKPATTKKRKRGGAARPRLKLTPGPSLEPLATAAVRTPLGRIVVVCSASGLREVWLGEAGLPSRKEAKARGFRYVRRPRWTAPAVHAIERFVQGGRGAAIPSDLPLDLAVGTPFQRRVWEAARAIPWGQVASYADVAERAGAPRAMRAVGNALGANPVPIVVPCHRVVHHAGSIGGFTSGLDWKRYLLSLEGGQMELDWRRRRGVLGLFR